MRLRPSVTAIAARAPTVSLTASHRVRVTDWFQARAEVPVSSSRAISGAPQNRPMTAGASRTDALGQVVLGPAPGLHGGDGALRGLGSGDGHRGQYPVGGLLADGVQSRLSDAFAGGLLRFPVQAELHHELSGLNQEGWLAEARVGGQRRCLSVVELAAGYEQVDQLRGRRIIGVSQGAQDRQGGRVVSNRCGGRPRQFLYPRRDHARLDQRVEPGGAVQPEVSQAHDGLRELLGPGLVQLVQ
jgi:hypothetical protein